MYTTFWLNAYSVIKFFSFLSLWIVFLDEEEIIFYHIFPIESSQYFINFPDYSPPLDSHGPHYAYDIF